MGQKIKDILTWVGFCLSLVFLVAFLGALEYVKSLEHFRIEGQGISDVCSSVESSSCGMTISGCQSKKEYRCVINVSVEPIR